MRFLASANVVPVVAAHTVGRIGLELNPEYFEIAKARVENVPKTLFPA